MDNFFSWETLATFVGATGAVVLLCQAFKLPLDKVWRIPTRVFVYILSVLVMALANVFIGTQDIGAYVMILLNAAVVMVSAMGTYDLTFKKLEMKNSGG
jgi:hypothetical protein